MAATRLICFDPHFRDHLLPLTFTRPVAQCRIGILKIADKWAKRSGEEVGYFTQDYLQPKFAMKPADEILLVNGAWCPSHEDWQAVEKLQKGESLVQNDRLLAAHVDSIDPATFSEQEMLKQTRQTTYSSEIRLIQRPWQIFKENGVEINNDLELLGLKPNPDALSKTNTLLGSDIYISEGATVEASTFNTRLGPIYIGPDAEVMENATVRGSFALCDHSALKMGAKIYGATTIGPHAKVGGEVNNSVIFGYSNKAHDGFLGNSVIGEWCNLGADTNNSNLKNNYAEVKLWDYPSGRFMPTGLQFCGLIMGDHSKSGINTMFNTGTVVGVSANIYGGGFPRQFIPSFSWGGANKMIEYRLSTALEVAEKVMERRGIELTTNDRAILKHIFENSQERRK